MHSRRLDGDEHAAHSYAQQARPDVSEYGNAMAQQLVCPAPDLPAGATWAAQPGNYCECTAVRQWPEAQEGGFTRIESHLASAANRVGRGVLRWGQRHRLGLAR
jgi:hypothetical protein